MKKFHIVNFTLYWTNIYVYIEIDNNDGSSSNGTLLIRCRGTLRRRCRTACRQSRRPSTARVPEREEGREICAMWPGAPCPPIVCPGATPRRPVRPAVPGRHRVPVVIISTSNKQRAVKTNLLTIYKMDIIYLKPLFNCLIKITTWNIISHKILQTWWMFLLPYSKFAFFHKRLTSAINYVWQCRLRD